METVSAHIYDFPAYYDLLFGSDWRAEFHFLRACFDRHARRPVKRLFEPACGTGRLLNRFAKAGYEVSGLDLNEKAIAYCNARLERSGFPTSTFVGDMTDFRLKGKVDAAFNTINSFRHLQTETGAVDHLRCVADCLKKGGIYVLGFHLTPTRGPICDKETWSARRGHLAVLSHMWSIEIDSRRRQERVGMTVEVWTPSRQFRIAEEMIFRTYTADQFHRTLGNIDHLEMVECYDFSYDIEKPVKVSATSEDVVFILRKK